MQQAILECEKGVTYYWYSNIDFDKKTIFLLHGLTANHTMFDKQIEFLGDKYNVIVWDAPAHGKSRPYSKSDIWWLKQIEWMCKPFSERMLKVSMAKQNAVTKAGRENMLEMVSDYEKAELCHLMGIGYAGFLDDNTELQIPCPSLLLVGEKDNTGKVKQYNKEWSKRTGIKITWIPNAAHNSNVDNPDFVNYCIGEFLANL